MVGVHRLFGQRRSFKLIAQRHRQDELPEISSRRSSCCCDQGTDPNIKNYNTARELLEQRYGNKQLIISAHMDDFLKLPAVNSVCDIKGIRQLYGKIEVHIRGLQALGVESDQYGSLLVPVLLNKVPQELRLIISSIVTAGIWMNC